MLKIVQNTKKGVYSLMSKLFLVENDFFSRYKTMNNKTKEIGLMNLSGSKFAQLCPHFAHQPTSMVQIFKGIFSVFIASFILIMVQNTKKSVYFLMSKLFLVENNFFPWYKTMNNKTKEIG